MKKSVVMLDLGSVAGYTALGQAFRAAGRGFKIRFIRFAANDGAEQDIATADSLSDAVSFSVMRPVNGDWDWKAAQDALATSEFQLVVLDGVTDLLVANPDAESLVLHSIANKPESMTVLLTGLNAPPGIVEAADLVTDILELKGAVS